MIPINLSANQPRHRFYRGGQRIAEFRGDPPCPPNTPEDWVASVTTIRGEQTAGLTTLPDGRLLVEAIEQDPVAWLGEKHLTRYGANPNMLVKILDPGQRLPVHAHPADSFARAILGAPYGKAEAWFVLRPGEIRLGLTRDVSQYELLDLVFRQRTAELLSLTHKVRVDAGDVVYVPPGVLHAIGEDVLVVEIQQPSDLSILLEWEGFALDGAVDGHLGLGFETAVEALVLSASSRKDVSSLVRRRPGPGGLLPPAAADYFRLDLVDDRAETLEIEAGLSVVVVLEGAVSLSTPTSVQSASKGATILVPAIAGPLTVTGGGSALVARPPDPSRS